MRFEPKPDDDIYAEEYAKVRVYLRDLFVGKDQKKIDESYSDIRSFADIAGLDPESIIEKVREGLGSDNPDGFANSAFEALKGIIDKKIEHPEIFEKMRR